MVPSLPVFLLDVNSPLGNQFRSTRKQSRPLQGFLFHHLCWGLKNWGLLNFSILHAEPKPRKGKAICNKVLMVFKHRMQDTVATSLQLISAGCKGCMSCVCMQSQFQQKDLNCSVRFLSSLPKCPTHPSCLLGTSKWEKKLYKKSYIKKEQLRAGLIKTEVFLDYRSPCLVLPPSQLGSGPAVGHGQEGVVPGSQVLWLGWPIKHRQDVKVLLQGKGLEHELDPVLVLCGDGPRAVGVIGVAIREPRALNGAIGTLQLEGAVLAWEREREPFIMARRTLRLCQRDGRDVLDDCEAPFPGAPSRHRGRGAR